MKSLNKSTISNTVTPSKAVHSSSHQSSTIKMKPIFRKKATIRCSTESNIIYIAKCRPKMLSTIELISFQSNQPNLKATRTVCQALKDAKRSSSLIIQTDESNSSNLQQLKHLFNNTSLHLKNLVVPYISLDENLLLDETAKVITRLRRCRYLANLDVDLYCTNTEMKNRILSPLLQQQKGLRNLETLNLDVNRCRRWERFPEDYEPNAPILKARFPKSLKSLSLNLEKTDFPHRDMLSTFITNLSRCNSLRYLNLNCGLNSTGPLDIKILAPLFERVQSLKSFKTNPTFPPRLQFQDSLDLVKNFESMKYLTELYLFIYFGLQEGSTTRFAKDLYKHIASLTNLQCLTLHLSVEKFFENLDEKDIFLPLQSLTNLKNLRFSLLCDEDKELPGLQSLSQAFKSLGCLEEFALFFIQNKVSRSHIISISDMLKKLAPLKTLSLIFHDSDLESDSLDLLSKGIAHLNLSTFSFNPRSNPNLQQKKANVLKHQKGLTSFFSTLTNFKSLHTLDLNLSVFDLLTKELRSLSLALKEKQFTYLYLELPQLPPDRKFQGLRSLISSIREMSKLATLQLIFKGDKLCDEEVEFVVSNISEDSKSLETLKLKFPETKELKNRSLLALKSKLQTLTSLRNLALVFGPNNIFSEETVYGLLEALSYLKNLEFFNINLPSEVVPSDTDGILRKLAGHLNLRAFIVNHTSWLKSVEH